MSNLVLSIKFKKANAIYSPGEILIGDVIVHSHKNIKINKLFLDVSGYAEVHW